MQKIEAISCFKDGLFHSILIKIKGAVVHSLHISKH